MCGVLNSEQEMTLMTPKVTREQPELQLMKKHFSELYKICGPSHELESSSLEVESARYLEVQFFMTIFILLRIKEQEGGDQDTGENSGVIAQTPCKP